jgi:hypothetical protein
MKKTSSNLLGWTSPGTFPLLVLQDFRTTRVESPRTRIDG